MAQMHRGEWPRKQVARPEPQSPKGQLEPAAACDTRDQLPLVEPRALSASSCYAYGSQTVRFLLLLSQNGLSHCDLTP